MNKLIKFIPFVLLTIFMIACKKDKKPLQIPSSYISDNYSANVAKESSLRSQLSALTAQMKKAENVANKLNIDTLLKYFSNNGTPSLKSITPSYYSNLIENSFLPTMVTNSQNSYDPADGATATNGGVYGARLLDKRGKEVLQEVEKGLFTSALYNHFNILANGNIDVNTVDQLVSIYGAHPNFPNTNTASKTPTPDAFIALYAARRDKNDGNGFYTKIRDQFIKLRAAVAAGDKYKTERDEAVKELKSLIEKAIMATVIHYGYSGISKLTSTAPSATTIAGGLHDFSEAVGFTHGFKAIPQSYRKITDAQIDEILNLFLAPANAEASMYKFVTNGSTTLPQITNAQQKIKAIYSFTDAEMEDFKNNWISIQGR